MSDINEQMLATLLDSNKALISSNESISESVRANSETVKELTVSVRELVSTERERVLKDKFQQEVNVKQEMYNTGNDALWKEAHDTIVRAKRFHGIFDSVFTKILVVFAIGVLALLGFSFK